MTQSDVKNDRVCMQKCLRLVFGAGISCVYLLLGLYQIFSLCKRAIAHQKWFSVQNFRCVKIKGCKRVKIKFGAYATTKISRCVLFSTFQRAWQYFPRNSRSKAGCMFGHRSMSGQIGSWKVIWYFIDKLVIIFYLTLFMLSSWSVQETF